MMVHTDWLCLEFTKTTAWEDRDSQTERLTTYAGLVEWGREIGCIDNQTARELLREANARPDEADRVLINAISLRSLTYRVFRTLGEGRRPGASELEALNDHVAKAAARRRITKRGDAFEWDWGWDADRLDLIVSKVVWSAASLLTAPECHRVRYCAARDCGWLFVDGSKNRSRKWCTMSDCGNRAKARRFRERERDALTDDGKGKRVKGKGRKA